jgi:hypothetical protein
VVTGYRGVSVLSDPFKVGGVACEGSPEGLNQDRVCGLFTKPTGLLQRKHVTGHGGVAALIYFVYLVYSVCSVYFVYLFRLVYLVCFVCA